MIQQSAFQRQRQATSPIGSAVCDTHHFADAVPYRTWLAQIFVSDCVLWPRVHSKANRRWFSETKSKQNANPRMVLENPTARHSDHAFAQAGADPSDSKRFQGLRPIRQKFPVVQELALYFRRLHGYTRRRRRGRVVEGAPLLRE